MKKNNVILTLAALMCCCTLWAQTSGNNSPYSRYGWGTLADESQSFNIGMGGVSLGMRGNGIINRMNPAAYSAIDSLTLLFDIGATLSTAHMSYNGTSVNPQNSRLDHVDAAFRLFKHVGLAIGFRPFSYIGYNFTSSVKMTDIDGYGEKTATYTYLGEGGLRHVYGGLGWEPIKNFSIGANVGYLWGDYSHSSTVNFSNAAIQSLRRNYNGEINTYTLDFGMQLSQKIGKKTTATLGLTAGLGHKIDQQARFINQKLSSGTATGADTLRLDDAHELPSSFGVGLTVNHLNRWTVGLDYTCQMWKDCRSPQLITDNNGVQDYTVTTDAFMNRHKFALGGQYEPNPEGFRFKDHINYRVGVSYSTPYFRVDGQDGPKVYTANVGIGLPIINKYSNRSMVNIALEYQRVEPSVSHSIREQYFNLKLGLMFNAKWFSKWKFE